MAETNTNVTIAGRTSGLGLEALFQRCEMETQKKDKNCNVLNEITEECVLAVEPLNQYSHAISPTSGIGQLIMDRFHPDQKGKDPTNKEKVPDVLYRKWGDVMVAWPASKEIGIRRAGCSLTSLTMVLRYLQKAGELQTVYDKISAQLSSADKGNLPVLGGKAWDPEKEKYYEFWYPVRILWWLRKACGATQKKWPAGNVLQTNKGILRFQAWQDKAQEAARDARKKAVKQAKSEGTEAPPAKRPPFLEAEIPDLLKNLDLKMETRPERQSAAAAHEQIVASLKEGYPAIALCPGHFVVLIGYVRQRVGRSEQLRWVINDPGWGMLQCMVNAASPGGYWKTTSSGDSVFQSLSWDNYYILKFKQGKPQKKTLTLRKPAAAASGSQSPAPSPAKTGS